MANSIGERYPGYELMTYFAAYTGLRAEELAGLEVGDLVFAPGPSCTVHVRRAKKGRAGEWTADTVRFPRFSGDFRTRFDLADRGRKFRGNQEVSGRAA